MEYINGFAKEDFLEYMYNQFPAIYNNTHSRELLENIVDYCTTDNFTHTKNELIYTLEKLIPEVTVKELLEFTNNKHKKEYEAKMTTIRSLEDLQTAIENHGWNITAYNDSYWDISQFSPAGEDFFFTINHNNSVKKAIEEISQYANDFDVDEHIEMWVEARQIDNNHLNVPSIRRLAEDAESIQEMLDDFAMYCNTLDFSSNCQ